MGTVGVSGIYLSWSVMTERIKCPWCEDKGILKKKATSTFDKGKDLISILFTMNAARSIGSIAPIQPIPHTQAD